MVRRRVLVYQLPTDEPYCIPKFHPKILRIEKVVAIFETVRVGIRRTKFCKFLIERFWVRARVLVFQLPVEEPHYILKFHPKILEIEKVIAIFEIRYFCGAVKRKSIDQRD